MTCTVFYSWQSDLPNATNRGFIEDALERAVKAIRTDDSIQVTPVVDRDTQDVPGAPNISTTILAKIDQAEIFVADVSIINGDQHGRHTPNPNVLIELGYALKSKGWSRVVMVTNVAYGAVEELPFDLRQHRVIPYTMRREAECRATERAALQQRLTQQLRSILTSREGEASHVRAQSPAEQLMEAVERSTPNQAALAQRYMQWVTDQLVELAPDLTAPPGHRDDHLMQALDQTTDVVAEFARVAQHVAEMDARDAAHAMYKGFERLVAYYWLPARFSGSYSETDFDFYKFMGHELFVTLFSPLIREDRWELVAELLDVHLYVENQASNSRPGPVPFHYVNQHVTLLHHRNRRLGLNKTSLHAEILRQRHADGPLAGPSPMTDFIEADYFLFLRSGIEDAFKDFWVEWIPWSVVFMQDRAPRYISLAIRENYAANVGLALGVKDLETLRVRLSQSSVRLRKIFEGAFWFADPLTGADLSMLGTG